MSHRNIVFYIFYSLILYNQSLFLFTAFIPAPIYFGRIFDSTCMLFAPSCDNSGACLEYNIQRLPFVLFGACLALKLLTFVFLLITYLTVSCSSNKDSYDLTSDAEPGGKSPVPATTPDTDVSTVSSMCASYSQQTIEGQSRV